MGSNVLCTLKPGESVTDVVDVGTLYDLSTPGVYTIRAGRTDGQIKTFVQSSPITIKVVPAESAQPIPSTAGAPALQPSFAPTIQLEGNATSSSQDPRFGFAIITKNISDHRVVIRAEKGGKEQAGSVYKVDVHDRNRTSPPEKEFGRLAKIRDDSPPAAVSASTPRQAGEALSLKPGEEWWDSIMLHGFYDLHKPGQYTIQVRRWDDETKTWVKSNVLTVTVTP
jgi:hypothetical protein